MIVWEDRDIEALIEEQLLREEQLSQKRLAHQLEVWGKFLELYRIVQGDTKKIIEMSNRIASF